MNYPDNMFQKYMQKRYEERLKELESQYDIASRKEYRYADIPGVPIVPTQGVMDKTWNVQTRGIVYVTPSVSELSCGKGQHSTDRLQGHESLQGF